jgi:hypothetical protein
VGFHLSSRDGLIAVRTERNVARAVKAVHPVVLLRDVPATEMQNVKLVNLMTLSHAQPKEPAQPRVSLCAATVRENSNENGENFKGVQYCKLLLS